MVTEGKMMRTSTSLRADPRGNLCFKTQKPFSAKADVRGFLGQTAKLSLNEIAKTCWNPKPGHHRRLSSIPSECPAMGIRWNLKFKPSQSKWHAMTLSRGKAEQGATDFEERPNQSRIGCLLLSINPPLLKQMSGNLT